MGKKAMEEGDDKESRQLNAPDQKDADFDSTPLAKTGHADQEIVFCEATLVVTSEAAQGAVKNLTA